MSTESLRVLTYSFLFALVACPLVAIAPLVYVPAWLGCRRDTRAMGLLLESWPTGRAHQGLARCQTEEYLLTHGVRLADALAQCPHPLTHDNVVRSLARMTKWSIHGARGILQSLFLAGYLYVTGAYLFAAVTEIPRAAEWQRLQPGTRIALVSSASLCALLPAAMAMGASLLGVASLCDRRNSYAARLIVLCAQVAQER